MNVHVIIGTETPIKCQFENRPQTGEAVALPDGRTVVINQLVHDLVQAKMLAKCGLPQQGKKK